MKQQNNNYWSGFGLGLVGGVGLMYILGTKKGRTLLRDFLNNTDEIEHSIEDIMAYIAKMMPTNDSTLTGEETPEEHNDKTPAQGLTGVMDKIRQIKIPKTSK